MTKFSKVHGMLAAALLTVGQAAMAGVINFENLNGDAELEGIGDTYSAQGFTFTYTPAPNEPYPVGLHSVGRNYVFNDGDTALNCNSDSAVTTLTHNHNRVYALLAIDLAELNMPQPTASVTFVGTTRSGATVTHTFELDGVTGFERFYFPPSFRNLRSVNWQQGDNVNNGTHFFDNVIVVPSDFKAKP
jgi:hypothetical protein